MDLMFSLTVRRIAGYRNELGDYYSNRTFCHISMGDNGNTEVDDFATVYQTFLEISIKSFPKCFTPNPPLKDGIKNTFCFFN